MEPTLTRKRQRTIEGVFNESPENSRLRQLVEPATNAPMVLATPTHVVPYGAKQTIPETFDVRVARILDDKLAPVFDRLAAIESRQATAIAQFKMVAKDVLSLRESVLRAAAIHVQETQETRRVALDVVAVGKPLARRALEREAEKMKKTQIVDAGRTFFQTLWDNRAVFVGTVFACAALFCVASMFYYITKR